MSDPLRAALLERAKREKAKRQQSGRAAVEGRIASADVTPEAQARAAAADQRAADRMALSDVGLYARVSTKAAQGIPFVGEWVDEGIEKIDPAYAERVREIQSAMDREYPKTALALEIGGGVLTSGPLALGAASKAAQASTMAGRVMRGTAIGAAAGAAEGASQGAGAANDGRRAEGAQQGAMLGAGIGGVVGALAPLVGDAAKSMAARVKKLDVKVIAEELGISNQAARVVKQSIINDDLDAAQAQMSRIGEDAMLADVGVGTGKLLDAAAQTGGKALRVMREAVEARSSQAGTRMNKTLDRVLGPAEGIKSAARDISQRTSKTRKAAYDRAYAQPIDYSGKGRAIEDVLSRVPPKTLNSAIEEANDAMRAEGVRNMQIMAEIADDGSVTFREMPNVQQLDFLKRALGAVARGNTNAFGRLNDAGLRAQKLAGQLRDAITDAVPQYGVAVRLGGDKIAEDQALDLGRRIFSKSTTFEDVRDMMRGASKDAKAAAKRGMREDIENTLSNVRRTITDPNTDAREAMQLVKDMSSRANEKKARLVLGTDAKALFDELEKAEAALALRSSLTQNSATAARRSIQQSIADQTRPGLIRRVLGRGGNPLEAAREITETVAGIDPASIDDSQRQILAEIADALVNTRGPEAERALLAVRGALNGQPIKDADAALIGRATSAAVMGGGYQVMSQGQVR